MTFLELVRMVARESGTVPGLNQPATVTGQTGRLARCVSWTAQAYDEIQTSSPDWLFRREAFYDRVVPEGARELTAAALGIEDCRQFVRPSPAAHWITLHDPEKGVSDQGRLVFIPWPEFQRRYLLAAPRADVARPQAVSIDPKGRIALYPTPDKEYRLSGVYQQTNQRLEDDNDVPEMPSQFHMVIAYKALTLLETFDEAFVSKAHHTAAHDALWARLAADQLPEITFGAPLA